MDSPSLLSAETALLIREHAGQAETQRHLTDQVVDALHGDGLYKMWIPEDLDGLGKTPAEGLEAIRQVASHDGAAGWCLMIAITTSTLVYRMDPAVAKTIYGPDRTITGGFAAPLGKAVADGDNLTLNGTWQWGSGTTHCTHIGGGCRMLAVDGEMAGAPRFVFAPASEVQLLDTWHVSGLSGTGSTDYTMTDVVVPAEFAIDLAAPATRPEAHGNLSFFGFLALSVASVAVGIADRAIEELTALAIAKSPAGSKRTLAARPTTQIAVAQARATVDSTWAYLINTIGDCWESAIESGENSVEQRFALRLAATDATQRCAEAVRQMYLTGGGEAVYQRSPLQKLFRDSHVVTQHAMTAERTYELGGRYALGLETDLRSI